MSQIHVKYLARHLDKKVRSVTSLSDSKDSKEQPIIWKTYVAVSRMLKKGEEYEAGRIIGKGQQTPA